MYVQEINEMTHIFSALGLYNKTKQLSNVTIMEASSPDAAGYSAAWTVAFAARAYIEKMKCSGRSEELVRIVIDDRVVPLQNCGADGYGRCTLSQRMLYHVSYISYPFIRIWS